MKRKLIGKPRKLVEIMRSPDWRRALLAQRVAAGIEHGPVLRQLRGCLTIVDVGANRGQFALAARHYFPDAAIVAFEPLPQPASVFRAVFAADAKVRLCESAIGISAGTKCMHISGRDDSSSLLPITDRQAQLFPGTAEVATKNVTVGRLSDYLGAGEIAWPALLKLDVQGYELEALRGCVELLSRFNYIYTECSFTELYGGQPLADEVVAWLRDYSFTLAGIYNLTHDHEGCAVQADILFKRETSASQA